VTHALSTAHITLAATPMTIDESKRLKKGTRVFWQGVAADSGCAKFS
jgi:hypothetical protein